MSEIRSFVRLFVGFILVATGAHASCPIELSPVRIVVKHGDPVSINCSTSETFFDGIGWEAKQGGTGVEPVSHLTWNVESLTDWTISPVCFITPIPESSFKQCKSKPEVVLYTFPEDISMSSSIGSDGVMKENEEYNFTCTINNIAPIKYLVVDWYKGDTVIQTQDTSVNSSRPVHHTSVFHYKAKREDSGVTFRCEAHLDLRPEGPLFNRSSQEYNITVHFGPVVQCSSLELLEGDTLERHCNVTGNPTPYVKWLKDGQHIDPSIPLSRKNAGRYILEAEGASSIEQELLVDVLYGPELVCPINYNVLEHTPLNLTCTVEGNPKPETFCHKDGEIVNDHDTLSRRDAGLYVITASNRLSNVSVTVEIDVIYSPSQILELEDTEVVVGSDVSLKCSSSGNPRPTYEWIYYRTDNVIEQTEDGVSLLLIKKANVYNMGSYTCHASNDRGNVSKTVKVVVKGAQHDCPIKITPDKMVVRYGDDGQNATCKPISTANLEGKIYWQSLQGARSDSTSWFVDTQKDWDSSPVCHGTFRGIGACHKRLNFTLYKTPDSVSIHYVDNSSSVVEDRSFQLRCDITNVAPAQNLVVRWYRGNDTFETHTKVQVAGCLDDNNPDCNISVIRSPVNVSSTISVTLNRRHSGKHFRCEAQLDLEVKGRQPPPDASDSLNITVQYKPIINTTKLPKTIPVFNGYPEELVCEADGYPPPKVVWFYSSTKMLGVSRVNLTVHEAGFYNCTASNEVDSVSHVVEVILKGPVRSSCPVDIRPFSAEVRFKGPLSAVCNSSSNHTEGMGWESSNGGVGLTAGVTSLPLDIVSVTDWALQPKCFINYLISKDEEGQCASALPVTVYKKPDSVTLSNLSVKLDRLVEGDKYRMKCDIVNVAPVKILRVLWHKGSKIFHTDTSKDGTLTPSNASFSVDLTAHRDDNGVHIWCEAKLDLRTSNTAMQSLSKEVIVLYPPAFHDPADTVVELEADRETTLNCSASGNPAPQYRWHLPYSTDLSSTDQNWHQSILTASLEHPGTYNCTAFNAHGSKTKIFTVNAPPRDRTVFAALIGGFVALAVLLFIGGYFFVTSDGRFSFCTGNYQPGQPTSSEII